MEKTDKHRIDRREFLKRLGAGVTAVSATTVRDVPFGMPEPEVAHKAKSRPIR